MNVQLDCRKRYKKLICWHNYFFYILNTYKYVVGLICLDDGAPRMLNENWPKLSKLTERVCLWYIHVEWSEIKLLCYQLCVVPEVYMAGWLLDEVAKRVYYCFPSWLNYLASQSDGNFSECLVRCLNIFHAYSRHSATVSNTSPEWHGHSEIYITLNYPEFVGLAGCATSTQP
jgi:hypothetical protein